jgi:hypothetical protein
VLAVTPTFEAAAADWERLAINAKRVLFVYLRRKDAAKARDLAAAVIGDEAADGRRLLVEALADGLSFDDEDFLERVIDDVAKTVSASARDLLSHLPQSRYALRMAERARRVAKVEIRPRKKTPHIVYDPDMFEVIAKESGSKRDGITTPKETERSGTLQGWISHSSLSAWGDYTPAEWLEMSTESEVRQALVNGWCTAIEQQGNAVWAEGFLRVWLKDLPKNYRLGIIKALAPDRREALVTEAFNNDTAYINHPWQGALEECKHAWSLAFSQVVLAKLDDQRNVKQYGGYQLSHQLVFFARQAHFDVFPQLESFINKHFGNQQYMHGCLDEMRRRKQIVTLFA